MEQNCISILNILTQEQKKILIAMIEESLNSMFPIGYEHIEFQEIKDNAYYDDYKKAERIWENQELILKQLNDVK